MSAPFEISNGLSIRLKSKKGYLAVINGQLASNGSANKTSEWIVTNVGGSIYTLKNGDDQYLGISAQLESICDADTESTARLEFVWLPSGRLCMMSDSFRNQKNRTGNVGPHVGVDPKGDMIGNAGRGEWGQFEAVKSESTVSAAAAAVKKPAAAAAPAKGASNQLGQSAVLSAPGSSALQLLANFTKHREMFGTGNYVIEQKPTKKVKACLTVDLKLPNLKVTRWSIVAPAPPSPLQTQNITGASLKVYDVTGTKLLSGGDMIQGTNGHYMFRCLARGAPHQVQIKYEIEAQLYSIALKQAGPGDFVPMTIPLSGEQRAYHLKPTTLMNFNDTGFGQWVHSNQLHPMLMSDGSVESALCYAYRVFLFIKIHFSYVFAKDVKGTRKASETIGYRFTDCGGFSILFGAILRMHGIPSRLLFGRWANTPKEGQNVHVVGEFYADGVGWIPFDSASSITGDNQEPYTKFFGKGNGNLIAMHLDHNIAGIDTVIDGSKQIEFCQGIAFWADGEGNFNNQSLDQKWVVNPIEN
ncbi:hypothetical protein DFA_08743 [Cavenderia fasciculata]|uniref:Transglutaminase-like domain-containing protein n=1 Tax=Cavenderia fasciculata TaxID=261658 RepID=F4Q3Y8_CACFS|nr:uncharacterized protein DFA_08743 [Cavenderia fasciculata]EGG17744.1 hypothetical protein DFA_08743 [Cavenderia fasciculata]|eukprot:XP_004356228.1 hypothetical protein DFA_08743 [Cavenderia fasciculata]